MTLKLRRTFVRHSCTRQIGTERRSVKDKASWPDPASYHCDIHTDVLHSCTKLFLNKNRIDLRMKIENNKSHFCGFTNKFLYLFTTGVREYQRNVTCFDLIRHTGILVGYIRERETTLNPRSCSQWMDSKVISPRSTDRLWRNC